MKKPLGHCNIVYVRRDKVTGWTWQAVPPRREEKAAEVYSLFYECVVAARARGYTPVTPLKCS